MIKYLVLITIILIIVLFPAETWEGMNLSLDEPFSGFASNDVGDIVYMDRPGGERIIWVGTGRGISKTTDGGDNWVFYDRRNGLNQNQISALAVSGTTVWGAIAYDQLVEGELIPYGRGFNKTDDFGDTWDSFIPQQVDFAGMIAYDIAIDDTTVWAACWYGGLIRSQDFGQTWENVFVDSFARKDFEERYFQHLNNRFFAVVVDTACPKEKKLKNSINDIAYDGKLIWVATQNGLQASVDLGRSWFPYDTSNGLSANGVHSLTGYTSFSEEDTTSFLCVGVYSGEKEYELPLLPSLAGEGFNYTSDYGASWDTSRPEQATEEKFAYGIAIADTVVWSVCGKGGLIRSFDQGETWENIFVDTSAKRRYEEGDLLSKDIFISIAVDTFSLDTTIIWAGSADGLYKFIDTLGYDGGADWIEAPVVYASPSEINKVIISHTVYERFGYGKWDPPDSIILNDLCYPYQGINPGDFFEIPIILEGLEQHPVGGFKLEIQFDYIDLTFIGAERGALLSTRWTEPYEPGPSDSILWSWEYFSYRLLPSTVPHKYKILLFGQGEMPDGVYRRGYCLSPEDNFLETYWAVDSAKYYHNGQLEWVEVGATLVWLEFQVVNNELLRDQRLPIIFEWEHELSPDTPHVIIEDWDCEENTMFSYDGYHGGDLYVSKDRMQYEPDICGTSQPGGEAIYTILDFVDGGVRICPREGELSSKSVFALGIQQHDQNKIIWASTCSEELEVSSCSTYKSTDGGETWTSCLGGVWVRDFAFQNSTVWAATDQGLKRTTDGGMNWETFEILDTAGQTIIPSNFTSVCVVDTTIWAGTVDGLAKSEDDGLTWEVTKFANSFKKAIWAGSAAGIYKFIYNYRDVFDTVLNYSYVSHNITGNWVVSLAIQEYDGKKIMWAGTQPTYYGENGASFSTDDGATWDTTLSGDRVWNFAFGDHVIWAATSSGLKRSDDWGENWDVFNFMEDKDEISKNRISSSEFTSVAIIDGEVWAGNVDGLVKSQDNGNSWDVIRTAVPIGTPGSETAYAYPSPFSPILEGGQVVRIRYRPRQDGPVTIKIYDFAMNLVTTLVDGQHRNGGVEYDEPWDGKNEKGDLVANGVYFFKVEAPGGQTEWGKLVILK